MSILEPSAQVGLGAKALVDPEDLRVLAKVLAAQNTIQHRERAIKILESSVGKNLANAEGSFPRWLDSRKLAAIGPRP